MGVLNTDLAAQLEAGILAARLSPLESGQTSTRHRHVPERELYVVLEGTGRIRVAGELLTLEPLSSLVVEPRMVRQVFNDTDATVLWLVVDAPPRRPTRAR
jgi:mannose-6-phosphate isomerase-like protein (cupin superfamily)